MGKLLALIFGVVSYAIFFVTFLYAIGFVGNLWVPKSIDTGNSVPMLYAVLINCGLLALFAVQHSVMARPEFKKLWTKIVPSVIERSVYVLLSSLTLILLFWLWQPIKDIVWEVQNSIGAGVLWGLFAIGWLMVLFSTFLINHFELFGLSQVFRNFRDSEPEAPKFRMPILYKIVRHPIMLGFIIAFWATPKMSVGHILFAVMTTIYILVAIQLEEKDLTGVFGDTYKDYQSQVSMIFPMPPRK